MGPVRLSQLHISSSVCLIQPQRPHSPTQTNKQTNKQNSPDWDVSNRAVVLALPGAGAAILDMLKGLVSK